MENPPLMDAVTSYVSEFLVIVTCFVSPSLSSPELSIGKRYLGPDGKRTLNPSSVGMNLEMTRPFMVMSIN